MPDKPKELDAKTKKIIELKCSVGKKNKKIEALEGRVIELEYLLEIRTKKIIKPHKLKEAFCNA